jgi:hypothetical protein
MVKDGLVASHTTTSHAQPPSAPTSRCMSLTIQSWLLDQSILMAPMTSVYCLGIPVCLPRL